LIAKENPELPEKKLDVVRSEVQKSNTILTDQSSGILSDLLPVAVEAENDLMRDTGEVGACGTSCSLI